MILHTATKSELVWEEISHHVLNRITSEITNILQSEIFYYKNDEVSVRATFKLQEMKSGERPFNLNLVSYTHISPDVLRLEFTETKHLADYATLEEAQIGAQNYFNSHYHPKQHHHHHLHH